MPTAVYADDPCAAQVRIQLGGSTTRPCCASRDRMPPHEDDDLSLLRVLADDFILDVAEQDPARVIKALVEACARLAAERHIATQDLQPAVAALLLGWHERSSCRRAISINHLTERADRAGAEDGGALAELERQKIDRKSTRL